METFRLDGVVNQDLGRDAYSSVEQCHEIHHVLKEVDINCTRHYPNETRQNDSLRETTRALNIKLLDIPYKVVRYPFLNCQIYFTELSDVLYWVLRYPLLSCWISFTELLDILTILRESTDEAVADGEWSRDEPRDRAEKCPLVIFSTTVMRIMSIELRREPLQDSSSIVFSCQKVAKDRNEIRRTNTNHRTAVARADPWPTKT